MRTEVDQRFRDEVGEFDLRFDCDVCAEFDVDKARCALGHPTEPHLLVDLRRARHVWFCKDFESVR